MSLKAKIEAVIYASEEPVTLAQLAGLFGGEVASALGFEEAYGQPQVGLQNAVDPMEAQGALSDADPEPPEEAAAEPLRTSPDNAGAEAKKARARDRAVREAVRSVLVELAADYAGAERGMEIREIAGGYRIATKPEYHDAVRSFVKSLKPPMKLSLQALETLAVIAYKQPVTAPEVNEIRGVDSGGVLGGLMSRKLIATAGRKQVIGRPILYKTTREFLLRFGLKDVSELPSMEEFEKMAGDIELEEPGGHEEVSHYEQLPFEHSADEPDPDPVEGDAVEASGLEANAGEPGVAVGAAEEESDAGGEGRAVLRESVAPAVVALDATLAEEAAPAEGHEIELITAVHPATTPDGE